MPLPANTLMTDIFELHKQIPETAPANFCIAPFQSIRQNPIGRNSPCAFGAGEWHHGHLTPQQRWNSTELNQLRQEFIDNKRPAACHRCWAEEDAGKQSLRQRQSQYFPNDYDNFIRTGRWLQGPKSAVFKVSNVCNLACRSCGGWDTNTYTKEGEYYQNKYNTKVGDLSHNRFTPLNPPKHMDFSQYYYIADNLEKIDFFGGEPFLNISQLDLLEYLTQRDMSKHITLYYSTNATNYPTERLKRAWNQFKRVEVAMSIDGTEQEFEYLRWPGEWDKTLGVIDHIQSLKHTLACEVYTMVSITVSVMNVWNIDNLIEWSHNKIGPFAHYINMVQSPDYLALHILPENIKQVLLARIKTDEVRGYLQLKPHDPVLFNQFIIWMKRQDEYREQKFEQAFPEYFELLKPYWDQVQDLSEQNFYRHIPITHVK